MRILRAAFIVFFSLFITNGLLAQMVQDGSKWAFEAKKKTGDQYELIAHLKLPKGWHIYAFKPGGDGSLYPPAITFNKNGKVILVGTVKEKGKLISERLEGIDGIVNMYKGTVDYIQLATITGNTIIKGSYSYQICNDQMCLPPATKAFFIQVNDADSSTDTNTTAATVTTATADSGTAGSTTKNNATAIDTAAKKTVDAMPPPATPKPANKKETRSLLWLFLVALGGGIAAVITPCVYSMIPITVSFFTKKSKTHAEGIRNALYYSLSIIIIFTVLGVLISAIFGSNALNTLSTNWIANLFFFLIFVIFGISFLGAFEITLPSSWTSKTDSKAGVGSFGGIFFMALTLVIVSFSCTGPIVGPLLVLAGKGGIAGPAIGMFGFSIGLAMPFALFAIFPGMLNKMASSGGWLNQVKVVLGFLELMLALKFLSNADLAMGWRLLDREIFIAIWIVLSVLLGFYLLGKLKFSHDDAPVKNIYGQEYVSLFKLFLAITSFTFAVYLLPGMWGAPLNGVSAFVPPLGTFDSFGGAGPSSVSVADGNDTHPVKYVSDMKIYEPPVVRNLGLVTYFDYDEALIASKKLRKPIMLDFTGINCVNCRKMESQVWSKPEVARRLKEDFIVVSLYCDINRIELPIEQQYFSKDLNSQIVTLGNKNADLQASKFGSNSQPFYFYVDENGNKLIEEGYSYDPDVEKFIAHLEKVKANYKKGHP
ncbi:MAG: cytochrome c biogenesis protein CcdA [Chitinophagales bacterium]